jgi:hypothetical protein
VWEPKATAAGRIARATKRAGGGANNVSNPPDLAKLAWKKVIAPGIRNYCVRRRKLLQAA